MKTYKNITRQELLDSYVNTDKSVSRARLLVGVTHKTFVRALKHNGLLVKGRQSSNPFLRDKAWLRKAYVDDRRSMSDIAKEIGISRGAVHSALTWASIPTRTSEDGLKLRYPEGRWGSDTSNWRGGRRRGGSRMAYIMLYMPTHPLSDKDGYVMEHRVVMESKIGRLLTPIEIVHHINGIKDDNRPENLELVASRGEHTRKHFRDSNDVNRLRSIMMRCDNCKKHIL